MAKVGNRIGKGEFKAAIGFFLMRYLLGVLPSLPVPRLVGQPTFVLVTATKLSDILLHLYVILTACGLVATDPEVPGSIPGAIRFSEK
jgi:hypothetical protein